jgi:hypothetical protein
LVAHIGERELEQIDVLRRAVVAAVEMVFDRGIKFSHRLALQFGLDKSGQGSETGFMRQRVLVIPQCIAQASQRVWQLAAALL